MTLGYEDRLNVLGSIESADPERGRAYVLGVFEAAEAPPDCFRDGDWLREPGDDRPECTSIHRDTTFCKTRVENHERNHQFELQRLRRRRDAALHEHA